jgi:hypothetical protein
VLGASSLRHDVPPGLLDREGLVRALPFEDPLVSVELPGAALRRAFERAARSASARDCRTQVEVAGALVRFRCPCADAACARVFATETDVPCAADADCGALGGACSASVGGPDAPGRCFAPLAAGATYRVATTAYLAAGGSGLFDAVAENARRPVSDSLSQALADELRHGAPCAAGASDTAPDGGAGASDAVSTDACRSGCASDALRTLNDACAEQGGAPFCATGLCERAVSLCRSLPCLDATRGAARDGRIRFEAP